MQHMVRTFVAVEVSGDVRARAARVVEQLRQTPARVRWVEPENMHLTLKFLDNVEAERIPDVCRAVADAARTVRPFDFQAVGVGAFPDTARPRTVWIGGREGTDEMIALHDALDLTLEELGFRPEHRRFRPHLTIGRVRGGPGGIRELAAAIAELADFECGTTLVEDAVVFASKLERTGPLYEVLGRGPLGS